MKYPIGIQNFEKLRREGYAYVDKTPVVWRLVRDGGYYFLSRPRRFGKSLLLSTIEAYFEGKRELFDGLAISQLETEWRKYPILHLDLNASKYSDITDLEQILDYHLRQWEDCYGRDERTTTLSGRFMDVILRAYNHTGMPVVILVDEYDKPMALNIDNEPLQDAFRSLLKAFYGVMKSADRYIKLGFLTGVTKFSKVSVFSDLNNISDISMQADYATSCGITEQEIRDYFDDGVAQLAQANGMTKAECYAALRRRYDGYHFRQNSVGVYNPFSLVNTLNKKEFADYWFATGTPTLLVSLLRRTEYNLNDILDAPVSADLLGSVDSMRQNPLPIIYQSGYLTIKDYDEEFMEYHLGFPSEEVERGFIQYLLPIYTNARQDPSVFNIRQFVREVRGGQPEAFMTRLSAMLADTDYRIVGRAELYLQNALFTFFRLLGLYVQVERATSEGRMDMVVQTRDQVYIFEFKIDKSADAALRQIEEKGYARPFAADSRPLYKIGVNFDSQKRCVTEWKVE